MLLRDFKQQGLSQRVAVETQVSPKEVAVRHSEGARCQDHFRATTQAPPKARLYSLTCGPLTPASFASEEEKETHPPAGGRPARARPAAPAPRGCAQAPCAPALLLSPMPPPPSSLYRVPAQQGAVVLCSGHTCLLFDLIACIPVTLTFLWSSKSMKASVPSGHLQALFPLSGKMFACLAPLTILG